MSETSADPFAVRCMFDAAAALRKKGEKRDRWAQKQTGQFRREGQDTAQSMFRAATWIEDAARSIQHEAAAAVALIEKPKPLIVGYSCTSCRTKMKGNRRFCPTCNYTVFAPIWSDEKPEWDDRLVAAPGPVTEETRRG